MTEALNLPLPDVLLGNLSLIRENLEKSNIDWVHLNVGDEGCGKTDFSILLCQAIDPQFNEAQVVYSFEELQNTIDELGDQTLGRALLLDEGGEMLFSRDWMRKENRELLKLFMRIRKKRLFFVVNIPRLVLDAKFEGRVKTISRCQFDINEKGILKQGKFKFYGYRKTREIFSKRKYPKPDFSGHFGLVSGELWNAIQQKNFAFLDGADTTSLARVRELNKHQLDRDVTNVLNDLIAGLPSAHYTATEILEPLKKKYGASLSLQLVGSTVRNLGFKSFRNHEKSRTFLVTREGVDALTNTFKNASKVSKVSKGY